MTVPLWRGMTLTANGQAEITDAPCSLEQFLIRQGLPPRSVVIEHNGDAVSSSEFPDRFITEGDRLEIVQIVAGG